MKLSAKPLSSPGRAEKYPPPLMMRFLRSNVGSRSRGRSRSSPMFVRKKSTAIETQEPSSPKVTCMGQVRVRRSKQAGSKPGKSGAPTKRWCKWIQNALFCHHFTWKHKPKSFRPSWRKWVSFSHVGFGFRRKTKSRKDPSKFESKFGNKNDNFKRETEEEDDDQEEEEEEEEEAAKVFVSTSSSPPKNALLLMRCRSAPYRSSSLASRFWGSPLTNEETEQEEEEETDNPTSEKESTCRDSDQESRMDPETEEKLGFFKEFDGSNSIKEKFMKSANIVSIEELKTGDLGVVDPVRPLILTRCNSEPARIVEKLDPDLSFWKKRRLGFT